MAKFPDLNEWKIPNRPDITIVRHQKIFVQKRLEGI